MNERTQRLEPPDPARVHTHLERVRFGDTDAAGIVYYANYLRWFEAGRAELMRARGVPYHEVVADGAYLPVVEAWCRYAASARYDDAIRVESWVHELRYATLVVAHRIVKVEDDRLLVEGGARLACVGPDGRPRRLPERIVRAIG
jgi:acyl-CoA thioester hydrolase